MSDIILRPMHVASVSGGKDSLYMMNVIFNNPDKYPLDMVVHFQLEIDWEFTNRVVDDIEKMCNAKGIKFVRIKPTHSWSELYEKYGMPTRLCRWCNSQYKIDCDKQLKKWIKEQNCRPVVYIGFCADENKRFKYQIGDPIKDVCYPLAEEGINEIDVLRWARGVKQFNGWYNVFQRQGCWLCPNATYLQMAYLYKYYPDNYNFFMKCVDEYESKYNKPYWSSGTWNSTARERFENKWIRKLNETEQLAELGIYNDKIRRSKN